MVPVKYSLRQLNDKGYSEGNIDLYSRKYWRGAVRNRLFTSSALSMPLVDKLFGEGLGCPNGPQMTFSRNLGRHQDFGGCTTKFWVNTPVI